MDAALEEVLAGGAAWGGTGADAAGRAELDAEMDAVLDEWEGEAAGRKGEQEGEAGAAEEEGEAEARAVAPPEVVDRSPRFDVLDVTGDDYLAVTSLTSGKRAYAELAAPKADGDSVNASALKKTHLLAKPVREMVAEVDASRTRRAEDAAAALANAKAAASQTPNNKLWVDKYRPRSYLDLLSDEQANRDILKWIKSWDGCVFGRTAAPKKPAFGTRAHQQQQQQQQRNGNKGNAGAETETDAHGRPHQRILLIAGPPGFGKTTAAHILAAHCGYRAIEINASDDRTRDTMSRRLADAVQMQSVTADKRPNLVVLDEVDGAMGGEGSSAGGAIAEILRVANGTGGGKKARRGGGGGSADKTNHAKLLRRPIVCICNDLYAPSLKTLREHAFVVRMGKPRPERVAERVRSILTRENVVVESPAAVSQLVERCDCDVRATVNALQLLMAQRREAGGNGKLVLRASDVAEMAGKDVQSTAFEVWDDVFHHGAVVVGERRKNPITRAALSRVGAGAGRRFATVYDMHSAALHLAGGSDVVMSGVHEQLSFAKAQDLYMKRYAYAMDSLVYGDMLGRAMFRGGSTTNMALGAYSVLPVLCTRHAMTSVLERSPLEYPRLPYVARDMKRQRASLLSNWFAGCPSSTRARSWGGASQACCEVLPYLLHSIAPAAAQRRNLAFSDAEASTVQGIVSTMVSYGLRYVNARPAGGMERGRALVERLKSGGDVGSLALDPPVDHLCSFGTAAEFAPIREFPAPSVGRWSTQVMVTDPLEDAANVMLKHNGAAASACVLSQATRQMLNHEVHLARMRKLSLAHGNEPKDKVEDDPAQRKVGREVAPSARAAAVAALEAKQGGVTDASKLNSKKRAGNWLDALRAQSEKRRCVSKRAAADAAAVLHDANAL